MKKNNYGFKNFSHLSYVENARVEDMDVIIIFADGGQMVVNKLPYKLLVKFLQRESFGFGLIFGVLNSLQIFIKVFLN